MSAVLVIIGWYAIGFVVAARLVSQGHSAPLWWPAAALLGAAVVLPAALVVGRRRRTPTSAHVVGTARAEDDGLHVLELTSRTQDDTALDRLPLAISARAGRTSIVGVVGHEAFSDVVDTGERAHMVDRVTWQRPFAGTADRLVAADSPAGVDAAVDVVGVPDVIAAPIGGSRRAARRGAAFAIDLARRHRTAVALLPPLPSPPAMPMRVSAPTREVSA